MRRPSPRGTLKGIAVAALSLGLGLAAVVAAGAATPTLGLTAGDSSVGKPIHATAQLAGGSAATGEITFEVFGPEDPACAGTALTPAPAAATVAGDGEYASGDFTPTAPGEYHWSAHYSGDLGEGGENEPADAICEAASTVAKAEPVLEGSASGGTVPTEIEDTVTVAGGFSPSGKVSFAVFEPGDTSCETPFETVEATLSEGAASSGALLVETAGEYRWTAEYEGDANNEAVSLPCDSPNQTSVVAKATPTLKGTATSVPEPGLTITDEVVFSGGFEAEGNLIFKAFGPGDESCEGAAAYQAEATVSGPKTYSPAGFAPAAGLYRWTVEYTGDANNEAVTLPCNSEDQASAVAAVTISLAASATGGTVGGPVNATATIQNGAVPGGQLTFSAFPPSDPGCGGTPAFTSSVPVAGNGPYGSAIFTPTETGVFRWTVTYSGDANHDPAAVSCGSAASLLSQAAPTIVGKVRPRVMVGTSFRDFATLRSGFEPSGTVTFRIYGPGESDCGQPSFSNTVAVSGNGTVSSAPFAARLPGIYRFVASYSGDPSNLAAIESCTSADQVVRVVKRTLRVAPRGRLIKRRQILIRAQLMRGASPSGVIKFRLYRPGDDQCKRTPAFRGRTSVRGNGAYTVAKYFATRRGVYRLRVNYSGDPRNKRHATSCAKAQRIRVG